MPRGLRPRFDTIRSAILTRENPPSFFDLQSTHYWWKKIRPEEGAMHPIVRCCTPSQTIGEGIQREFSCRHTPQQNGVAERKNRHVLEATHAMMHAKHMPNYWTKAASTTVYLINRCTTNGVHELTPYEILVGRKPIHSHLNVFESIDPERKATKVLGNRSFRMGTDKHGEGNRTGWIRKESEPNPM